MNDPLGAMAYGLQTANETLQTNVQKAAENIKNNENLKQALAQASEQGYNGLSQASEMAGSMAGKLQ